MIRNLQRSNALTLGLARQNPNPSIRISCRRKYSENRDFRLDPTTTAFLKSKGISREEYASLTSTLAPDLINDAWRQDQSMSRFLRHATRRFSKDDFLFMDQFYGRLQHPEAFVAFFHKIRGTRSRLAKAVAVIKELTLEGAIELFDYYHEISCGLNVLIPLISLHKLRQTIQRMGLDRFLRAAKNPSKKTETALEDHLNTLIGL